MLCLKQRSVNSLTSLYNIRSLNVSCDTIKQSIWNYNVRNAVDSGRLTFIVEFLFNHIHCMFLMLVFYVCVFLCAASCVINDDDDDTMFIGVVL